MAGNRFRYIDYWHFSYINSQNEDLNKAADDIISNPETHLLSQEQLFNAEGGWIGVGVQLGVISLGLCTLFAVRPRVLTYLKNAQLRPFEWALLGATSFVSYRLGYCVGTSFFGDH